MFEGFHRNIIWKSLAIFSQGSYRRPLSLLTYLSLTELSWGKTSGLWATARRRHRKGNSETLPMEKLLPYRGSHLLFSKYVGSIAFRFLMRFWQRYYKTDKESFPSFCKKAYIKPKMLIYSICLLC